MRRVFMKSPRVSWADSLSSSDNDDAEKLELVIRSAYACSPKKHKLENDPALRNSLLLWDKEFVELEGNCKSSCKYFVFVK